MRLFIAAWTLGIARSGIFTPYVDRTTEVKVAPAQMFGNVNSTQVSLVSLLILTLLNLAMPNVVVVVITAPP